MPATDQKLDVRVMAGELERTLGLVMADHLRERPNYRDLPAPLLELRHVALSGDGEPTLCPEFIEVVEAIIHLRARGRLPFFKLVLLTNASGLDRPDVQTGLRLFTPRDEIWVKLEAGTQDYMNRVNRPDCTLEKILANILRLARERPVIVQSLFPSIVSQSPPLVEIEAFARRLKELKESGAQIRLVQIYSATRPTHHSDCGHLHLRTLSNIAQSVREIAGLPAEVY